MAVNKLQLKRSAVAGKEPTTSSLALGELAINTYEGKVFLKKDNGVETIVQLADVSGSIFSASYAQTSSHSNNFTVTGPVNVYGSQYISGSLVVGNDITARRLVVQTITSSVIYSSGSNIFGDATSDTQTFTGSVNISGSLNLVGNQTINSGYELTVDDINVNTIGDRSGGTLTLTANTSSVSGFLTVNNSISASGKIEAVSFTGSFSGSINNLQGTATHIPYFSSSQVLQDSIMYQTFNGDGSNSIAINQNAVTTAAPEALYVWQPSSASFNVISGKGNLDNYLQLNIQNTNQGVSASSDIVATANNGNETIHYIDMGINNENFAGFLGGPNDAYLYSTGHDLWIGNYTDGRAVKIFNSSSLSPTIILDIDGVTKIFSRVSISGSLNVSSSIVAQSFITRGATAAEFVKGDGSLDSTLYTSASVFNNTTSSLQAFSASMLAFTASTLVNSASFDTRINYISSSFNASTASFNAYSASMNAFSASMLSFTASQKNSNGTFATTGSNIFKGNQIITGSLSVSGSTNIYGTTNITGSVNVSGSTGTAITANVDTIVFTGSYAQLGNVNLSSSVDITGSLVVNGRNYINDSSSFDTRINYISSSFNASTASINSFTASMNAFSASMLTTTASLNAFSSSVLNFTSSTLVNSASFDTRINYVSTSFEAATASLNLFSASMLSTTASINNFSASMLSFTSSTLVNSASFDTRINYISSSFEAATASLNLFSASVLSYTASNNEVIAKLYAETSSLLANTASMNLFSASILSYTASNNEFVADMLTETASLQAATASLNANSASMNLFSASILSFTSSTLVNSASFDTRINYLSSSFEANTASLNLFTASFNAFSSSILNTTASINAFSASILSFTASQKDLNGTLATTGSNTFIGNQVISGSTSMTGSLSLTGSQNIIGNLTVTDTITAQRLVVQFITSSVAQITGSTKFGDEVTDTHQFTGSVLVSGSLVVNGRDYITDSGSFDTRINYISSSFEAATASLNLFSASILSYTASNNEFVADMLTETASLQAATASLNLFSASILNYTSSNNEFVADILTETASLQAATASLNLFSASMLSFTASTLVNSASFDTRINYISSSFEASTASLNAFSASILSYTASNNEFVADILLETASLQAATASLYNFSSSILNYTASNNEVIAKLYSETASLNAFSASVLNFTASTLVNSASFDTRIQYVSTSFEAATASLNAFSASILTTTSSINNFSASVLNFTASTLINSASFDTRINYISSSFEAATASINAFSASILSYTASNNAAIADILVETASLQAATASLNLFSASMLSFTASQKNLNGTFATTGSNTFIGNETISGSLNVTSGITGSLLGTSSYAISSSYASTSTNAEFSTRTTQVDVYVKNMTGTQINKGTVVRIIDAVGDNPLIQTASYTNDANSANTLGITTQNIPNDSFGYVVSEGILIGIDTSAYIPGQLLYLGLNGAITGSAPLAPLHSVRLGEVLRVQVNNGSMYVSIDNGYEIGELHNVIDSSTTASYGDLFIKNGNVWINSKQLTGSYGLTGSLVATSINATSLTASNATIGGNLVVNGTASFNYVETISGSAVIIGQEYIVLNTQSPAARFAGLKIYDSGSANTTASIVWDSERNHLVYQNASGSSYSGGGLMSGPRNTGSLGDEIYPTLNRVLRGQGGDHLYDSNIFDDNNLIGLEINTAVTGTLNVSNGITGSLLGNVVGNVTGNLIGTASYSSNTDLLDGLDSTQFVLTSSFQNYSASMQAFSASVLAYTASNNTTISQLYAETASILSYTASAIIDSGSVSTRLVNLEAFSSSLDATFATDADLNALSSSFIAYTASLNNFSASILNYTSSTNATISDIQLATASLYAFSASMNSYTASNNTTISQLYAETASILAHTASINAFSASINAYTSSNNDAITSLYNATASLNLATASLSSSIAILSGSFLSASSSFDTRINSLTESVFTHVVTNNGASNYIIDGVAKPILSFVPGATYRFDTTVVGGSHPFRFSTSPNGPTQYTTGVTSGSNYIQIEVNYDTPTLLYYYCTIHSGMGNEINVLRIENLVTTASFSNFSSSINAFSASILNYTSSTNAAIADILLETASFNAFSSSILNYTASNNTTISQLYAETASLNAFSASMLSFTASQKNSNGTFATTGSNVFEGVQTINSNLVVTGSITAQTLVVQTITSSVDFVTGSTHFGTILENTHQFTGSVSVSGSLAVNDSNVILTNQTASMSVATASYWSGSINNVLSASYALTASHATNVPETASFANNATSASYSLTASFALNVPETASFALTASYWSGSINNALSSSYALTASHATNVPETASFANNATSASYALTASFALNVPLTSSFALTASYWSGSIQNAVSAAFADIATSASYSATASYALFALNGGGGGGGGSVTTYQQVAQATTWSISHFLNTQTPVVQVYDDSFNTIIPTTISNPGAFQTFIYFEVSQSGYAVLTTGGGLSVTGSNVILNQTVASTTWSFNHDLKSQYPVFTIFDDNDDVIIPQRIHANTTSSALIYFSTPRTGKAVASLAGFQSLVSSSISSSFATNAANAANATNAQSASYAGNYLLTSSFNTFSGSFVTYSGSINNRVVALENFSSSLDATFATDADVNAISASLNAYTASNNTTISALYAQTSSINAFSASILSFTSSYNTGSFTGSFVGTASFADNATSASFASTASYWSGSIDNVLSASYAATASYADNFTVAGTLTAQTLVIQTITSSVIYSSGSNKFGNDLSNTQQLTGSVTVTGSLAVNGSNVVLTNQTASMSVATASFASTASFTPNSIVNAVLDTPLNDTIEFTLGDGTTSLVTINNVGTASLANTASFVQNAQTASYVLNAVSSSYAATASFALNGGGGGISAISIADEGILQGSASYFDFTGNGVSVVVASNTASFTISGGGSGTQGLTTTFTQSSAAVSWSFTHNLNTRTPVVQVYDSGYNQITPQYISSSNANEVVIGFGIATTGYAVISTGGALVVTGSNVILNQTASATTWSFNHGLNQQYPVFQVFNTDDEVIVPERIKAVDSASALIYFPTPVAGKAVASFAGLSGSIGGGSGAGFPFSGSAVITGSFLVSGSFVDFTQVSNFTGSLTGNLTGTASYATFALTASTAPGYTVQFSQTASAATWSFTHNMGTRNPIVQVYGSDYKQLIPNDIVGIDGSTVEVRFDYATTGYAILSNGGGLYITGSTSTLIQTSAATTWSFNHQLNTKYPAFEVYDENDLVIIPAGIKAIDVDNAEIYFAGAQAGRAIANFSGINGLQDNAVSASYASSGSVFHVDKVVMDRSLMDFAQVNSSIVGSNNMFTQATGSYTSMFVNYTVASGSNARSGQIIAVWNAGTTEYNDVSTNDIGDTTAVTGSVSIVTGEAQLNFQTNTSGWRIKSTATFI